MNKVIAGITASGILGLSLLTAVPANATPISEVAPTNISCSLQVITPAVPAKDAVYRTEVVPAVYETLYEFAHRPDETNGNGKGPENKWQNSRDWNAEGNPNSVGWVFTGNTKQGDLVTPETTRQVEVSPAVPEVPAVTKEECIEENPVQNDPAIHTPVPVPVCSASGELVLPVPPKTYTGASYPVAETPIFTWGTPVRNGDNVSVTATLNPVFAGIFDLVSADYTTGPFNVTTLTVSCPVPDVVLPPVDETVVAPPTATTPANEPVVPITNVPEQSYPAPVATPNTVNGVVPESAKPTPAPKASVATATPERLAETGANDGLYIWGASGLLALIGGIASLIHARRKA